MIVTFDRWTVRQLPFEVKHLAKLWVKLDGFPTLFSDTTRGDVKNWIELVKSPNTLWLEVLEGEEMVGIVYFILGDDEADVHLAFYDRRPSEKKDLIRAVLVQMFETFPKLERISAEIPEIYYGTSRLAKAVGMVWEGTKRQAVAISGRRVGVHIYSLLRNEAYGLPEESRQSGGDPRRVRSGWNPRSEARGSGTGR